MVQKKGHLSYFDLFLVFYYYYNAKSVSFQLAEPLPTENENNKIVQRISNAKYISRMLENSDIGRCWFSAPYVQNEALIQGGPLCEPSFCPYLLRLVV